MGANPVRRPAGGFLGLARRHDRGIDPAHLARADAGGRAVARYFQSSLLASLAPSASAIRAKEYQAYLAAPTESDAASRYHDVERAVSRSNTLRGLGVGLLIAGGALALSGVITYLTLLRLPAKVALVPDAAGMRLVLGDDF